MEVMEGGGQAGFWDAFSTRWQVDPPQAPDDADLAWFQREAERAAPGPGPFLVLGATPQFARVPWPAGAWPVATDFSRGMLARVWPRPGAEGPVGAVRCDWRDLAWRAGSTALAVGDGCFGVLPGLGDVEAVCREVVRVLRPGGRCLMRCFVRDPGGPGLEDLFAALRNGEVRRIGWFRWQVAMALQAEGVFPVDRDRVFREWTARVPDWEGRIAAWGLPEEPTGRIRRWEGERTPLHFPDLDALRPALERAFRILAVDFSDGPHGACFPRLVMEPRR